MLLLLLVVGKHSTQEVDCQNRCPVFLCFPFETNLNMVSWLLLGNSFYIFAYCGLVVEIQIHLLNCLHLLFLMIRRLLLMLMVVDDFAFCGLVSIFAPLPTSTKKRGRNGCRKGVRKGPKGNASAQTAAQWVYSCAMALGICVVSSMPDRISKSD